MARHRRETRTTRVSACWERWPKIVRSISFGRRFPRLVEAAAALGDIEMTIERASAGSGGQNWPIGTVTVALEGKDMHSATWARENSKLRATRDYFVLCSVGVSWFRSG